MTLAARHLRNLVAACILLAGGSAPGGTVYWNMNDLSTTTLSDLSNLAVSTIAQFNTTTTGGTTSSASSGYSFLLDGTTTAASGSTNLIFSAKPGNMLTGSSSYMSVTLTPSTGYSGTVSAIGFGSRSTTSGPTTLSLRSSLDNWATEVAGFSPATSSTWAYFTSTFSTPLTIASGSSLSLRLYGYGGSSASSGNWRLDDLQLTVVVVPEPTTILLAFVGGAAALAQVRRISFFPREWSTQCAEPKRGSPSSNCSL